MRPDDDPRREKIARLGQCSNGILRLWSRETQPTASRASCSSSLSASTRARPPAWSHRPAGHARSSRSPCSGSGGRRGGACSRKPPVVSSHGKPRRRPVARAAEWPIGSPGRRQQQATASTRLPQRVECRHPHEVDGRAERSGGRERARTYTY